MIKFKKFYVTNGATKARVFYNYHNHVSANKMCVTLHAKSYGDGRKLEEILGGEYENNSDLMTDYFEEGLARLLEGHPLFEAAKAQAEAITKQRLAA